MAKTKQRKLILEIIMTSSEHMTAEEIYIKAKEMLPSIAIGTVYRNLGLMAEAGEIRRIIIPNKPDRFDKSVHPHEHLICDYCGELTDISVNDLKGYLEKQTGIEILGYNLSLRYICNKCKEKTNNQG
ncbi:MAG: Fur family transcriptional regulator [Syntrophomonadaceae bacterium]|jgi:Fe2+ or Zn2+ uptake regulation protein